MSALYAINYVLQRFVLRRRYLQRRVDGLILKVRTEDVVGRHIYKYGHHEPAMSAYLASQLKPENGDMVIDIGANIGWYSVMFSRLCANADCRVLCFEPEPDNLALLRHNLAANHSNNADVFALGLSDNDGGASLHLFGEQNRGRHSLLPINDHHEISIKTARLDDLISAQGYEHRTPRLIKIDIEGFELIALRGAPQTLARCPLLVTEFSPHYMRQGGLEPAAMLHYLRGLGFEAGLLAGGQRQPVDVQTLLDRDRQCDIIWTR